MEARVSEFRMQSRGLERVLIRNQFYWQNYRYVGIGVVCLLTLLLLLTGFIFYQKTVWPKPKYFATTPDGQPIQIIRLNEPIYTDPAFVLQWVAKAVVAIYGLDYVTWRTTLQNAEVYFTTAGYQAFLNALQISTNLEAIKAKRQVVSLQVSSTPKLLRQGQINKNLPYSWDIQLPVTVVYQNSENEVIRQIGTILVRVERASLLRHREGIAISQLVLQAQ